MTANEAAKDIMDVLVRTGDVRVAHEFAKQMQDGGNNLNNEMRLALQREDERKAAGEDQALVAAAIASLAPGERELMATLALAGYRFHRGTFYWRCVSPTNMTVESLQPQLLACIIAARDHNEERVNGKPTTKPKARR